MLETEEAQNVGELLRNTRLKKGKTLGDVSKDLCIRKFYLEAIENLSAKDLPPVPYGLGFVRSYAEYLGLNAARIVQAYRQAVYPEPEENPETQTEENASAVEYAAPNLRHIIIGLVGILLIFAIWHGISSYNQEKQLSEEKELTQNDVVPEPVIIEENEPALAEMGLEDADSAKAEPAAVAEPLATTEPTEKKIEAEPQKSEMEAAKSTEEKNVINEAEKTENKTAETEAASPTPTKIRIVFVGPSWLELKQGDKVLLSGIYSKGFKYDVPDEVGTVVSVGRYYNVDFYVNGKLTKVASAMKQTNISLDKYILPEQKQD